MASRGRIWKLWAFATNLLGAASFVTADMRNTAPIKIRAKSRNAMAYAA
jgi:hypothetical protein